MRAALPAFLVPGLALGLAACTATLPDSSTQSGVGFGNYAAYVAGAQPAKKTAPAPGTTASSGFSTGAAAAAIDAATGVTPPSSGGAAGGSSVGAPLSALSPSALSLAPAAPPATAQPVTTQPVTSGPLASTPTGATPAAGTTGATTTGATTTGTSATGTATASGSATVSAGAAAGTTAGGTAMTYAAQGLPKTQSFSAAPAGSTASDAALIAANRAKYVVIQPTQVPQRADNSGPDIAKYAQMTTNPVGVQLYQRPSVTLADSKTACLQYKTAALAQEAFLAAGGPQNDPKGLDPDGDGFACNWDPTPYRKGQK